MEDVTKLVQIKPHLCPDTAFLPNTIRITMYIPDPTPKYPDLIKPIGVLKSTGWDLLHGYYIENKMHPSGKDDSWFKVWRS